MKRKLLIIPIICFMLFPIFTAMSFAKAITWSSIANDMGKILDNAHSLYKEGKPGKAKKRVSEAYLQHYEKKGFEKITLMYISGKRVRSVELQFRVVKRKIKNGVPESEIKSEIEHLKSMVVEDAQYLDGGSSKENSLGTKSAWKIFVASFIIIVREGAEAILIVAAILSFLIKVGSFKSRKSVYMGVVLAIFLSFVVAGLLQMLNLSGKQNEIFEAITIAVAVVMLFYVGNWFQSKSSGQEWNNYIKNQVSGSLERGSELSLAFTAFLAVFREGAETILFYQAIPNDSFVAKLSGFLLGLVVLAGIYFIIRFLSLKIPLKPFFLVTSILIYIMAVLFVGSIAPEFQEAGILELTILPGLTDRSFSSISWLGIYPYYETVIPQLIAIAIAVGGTIKYYSKNKNSNLTAD